MSFAALSSAFIHLDNCVYIYTKSENDWDVSHYANNSLNCSEDTFLFNRQTMTSFASTDKRRQKKIITR